MATMQQVAVEKNNLKRYKLKVIELQVEKMRLKNMKRDIRASLQILKIELFWRNI